MLKWFWLGVNPLIPPKYPNISIFGSIFQLLIIAQGPNLGVTSNVRWWGKQPRSWLQKMQALIFLISFPPAECGVHPASDGEGRPLPPQPCGQALQHAEQSQPSQSTTQLEISFGWASHYLKDFVSQHCSNQKKKILQTALIVLRSFRRKEKSSWDVFILVLPGSWTTDQYTTQEALRNIFKQKQMKQESGPNSVHQLSQESSLVLLLKVFWPFWSKEHWGESRLGWGFFV